MPDPTLSAPIPSELVVEDLHVTVAGKPILQGVDLRLPGGQVHALMGPNGSGKSTLAATLMGHPAYTVTSGSASFGGVDLLEMTTDERARLGLFLSLQYPTPIPGVSVMNFLRAALEAQGRRMPAKELIGSVRTEMQALNIDETFRQRSINDGFSGGEKKRMEILQLALLRPRLAILDETDSGLDVDALRTVSEGVSRVAGEEGERLGVLVITHYPRILQYLRPDVVHVFHQGRIVTSGDAELAQRIEREGYDPILAAAAGA